MTQPQHTLRDCPQGPVIEDMRIIISRVSIALETIAAQAVVVSSLVKITDRHDTDIEKAFHRIRQIEIVHIKDEAVEEVTADGKKFWTELKLILVQPVVVIVIFLLIVLDKLNLFTWLSEAWKSIFK